jgi:exodeoxyribonuclease VII large subunit
MAVPVRAELIQQVDGLARRQRTGWLRGVEARRKDLRAAARALPTAESLLAKARQDLDALAERLPRALKANAQIHHTAFSRIAGRLNPAPLRTQVSRCREKLAASTMRGRRAIEVLQDRRRERFAGAALRLSVALRRNVEAHGIRIARERERTETLGQRAARAMQAIVAHKAGELDRLSQLLDALSYRGVLARGFALVRDTARRPIRSATAASPGLALEIEFADGRVGVRAEGAATPLTPPRIGRPRKRGEPDPNQGNLFG